MKTLLATLTVAGIFALSANASIIVDHTEQWQSTNATLGGTIGVDISGSDKLVVIVTGEHGFNQTGNGLYGTITLDGAPMTLAVGRQPIKADANAGVLVDDTWNAIYYIDNPTAGGVLVTSGFSSRGNVGIIALSGTAPGVGSVTPVTLAGNGVNALAPRDTNTANLTTSAGSIVIGSYGMGGTGNTATLSQVTTPGWDAEIARQENGNNWDGHVVAYQNNVAAGAAAYTFTDSGTPGADGRTGRHVLLAEFQVIPEPASLALMGLGGLMMLRRR